MCQSGQPTAHDTQEQGSLGRKSALPFPSEIHNAKRQDASSALVRPADPPLSQQKRYRGRSSRRQQVDEVLRVS